MTPLLQQFLSEAGETLEAIGADLMALEGEPGSAELVTALFRRVHTLKGNSGLFDFPELTRVLHASEDLMDQVRDQRVSYSAALADALLAAMDFVGLLCEDIAAGDSAAAGRPAQADALVQRLRAFRAAAPGASAGDCGGAGVSNNASNNAGSSAAQTVGQTAGSCLTGSLAVSAAGPALPAALLPAVDPAWLQRLPAEALAGVEAALAAGNCVHWLRYSPDPESFFQGCDPLHLANQTPALLWGGLTPRAPWPELAQLDAYRCELEFDILSCAGEDALRSHYRYVSEQVSYLRCPPSAATEAAIEQLIAAQHAVLCQADGVDWLPGRLRAVAATLSTCWRASGRSDQQVGLDAATAAAVAGASSAPLLAWLVQQLPALAPALRGVPEPLPQIATPGTASTAANMAPMATMATLATEAALPCSEAPLARRAEDGAASRTLRVDQAKVDRMADLIGEMVVAKNAMPYLANRAEHFYGSRDMARELKAQHAVIHRISEELQDAIMQMRMLPVSFVFQRFPRLVRDLAQRLGKQVRLVLDGEQTAADKNMIEALGDPLVHIVRNCLDHGLETPAQREAQGKPAQGTLRLAARQQADRILIDISDDGAGIDPAVIRRKALQKGLADQATLERLSDQEVIQLVFAPGFSTAETVSDLSGRGVGMDAVRTTVEQLHGSITLNSTVGRGTLITLSLPLSMAVSTVLTVEARGQLFGVPLSLVVETVRVNAAAVRQIKHSMTTVLRGRVVPLRSLHDMLGLGGEPLRNLHDELAVLVVDLGNGPVGLLIDDFQQTADIVLKPLPGVLARLPAYAGSAMMGDGSVLMVLNLREIL